MSNINAVIAVAKAKVMSICDECRGKKIPNLAKIDDALMFSFTVTEADLNLRIGAVAMPVPEEGPGSFLVRIGFAFVGEAAYKDGFHFEPTPLGPLFEIDVALSAEEEQELTDAMLVNIGLEAENILCRMLQ